MKSRYTQSIVLLFVFLFSLNVLYAGESADSIIFKAMADEMKRAETIQKEGFDPPNFIAYTFLHQDILRIESQQGALFFSGSKQFADATWRLTVGSNQLNDENFQNNMDAITQDFLYELSKAPIYADYMGIRNYMWVMTNRSYNMAASNYKNKKEIIKKYDLEKRDELLPDFSEAEKVNFYKKRESYLIDKSQLEQKTRAYSSVFKDYKEIEYAESRINVIRNNIYYYDSDGNQYYFPLDITQLFVKVKRDFSGDFMSEQSLAIYANTPEDLPSDEEVEEEIGKLVRNLKEISEAEPINENYNGPVLIEGKVVGDVLLSSLFSYDYSLNARRQNLVVEGLDRVFFEELTNRLQTKTGDQVLPDHISVISYPRMKEYNGIKLIGYFDVDAEAVMPADSLVMIENGILRNLFTNRVPTTFSSESNGYRRHGVSLGSIGNRNGPGTLLFKSSAGRSVKELKEQLIQMAKDKGFEYAYIVRSVPGKIANLPANCYRVDVKTGEEKLLKDAAFRYKINPQTLKKSLLVSDSTIVYNLLWSNNQFRLNETNQGDAGLPVSLIMPSSILVDYSEIRSVKNNTNLNVENEQIPNPLDRTK